MFTLQARHLMPTNPYLKQLETILPVGANSKSASASIVPLNMQYSDHQLTFLTKQIWINEAISLSMLKKLFLM